MIIIKIHKIMKRGLNTKCLRVEVPGRAWLHLHHIGPNPSYMGIPISDFSLELNCLMNIFLFFKRNTQGEEKFTRNPILFQLVKALHQILIGIGISFIHSSHPIRAHIWGEDEGGFRSRKCFLKRLDKIDGRQSEGFKETIHLNSLLPDVGEEVEEVFGPFRIWVEANMEGFISVRDCLSDGLENLLHPSEGHFRSTGNHLLRENIPAAPGALDRAASAQG
jgi:hypothetical protein